MNEEYHPQTVPDRFLEYLSGHLSESDVPDKLFVPTLGGASSVSPESQLKLLKRWKNRTRFTFKDLKQAFDRISIFASSTGLLHNLWCPRSF